MSDILINDAAPAVETVSIEAPQGNIGAWYEKIENPETRGYIESKGFQSIDDIVTNYKTVESMVQNKDALLMKPSADATPEEVDAFYNKLGRPEKATDYGLDKLENANPELANTMHDVMHKAGLTLDQAKTLGEHYNKMALTMQEAAQRQLEVQHENETKQLQSEWAQNFDANVELSRRAARALGVDAEMATKIQNAIGVKAMMNIFNKVGAGFKEDTFRSSDSTTNFGMSLEGARARLQAYKTDKGLRDAYLNGDTKARNEVDTLNRILANA